MSSFLSQIAKINEHLYLSSFVGATEANINKLGITCVITVCKEVPKLNLKHVESIKLDVLDRPNESLAKYFDYAADKIKEIGERNGSVLVHCVAGVSRSATIVIAYLMKHAKMMLRDAHDYVKSKRPFIRPNLGFWKQLVEYEAKIYGRNSVRIISSNVGWIPDIYENEVKNMTWTPAASAATVAAKNPSFLGGLSSAFSNLSFSSTNSSSHHQPPLLLSVSNSSSKENGLNNSKQHNEKKLSSVLSSPQKHITPISIQKMSPTTTSTTNSTSTTLKPIVPCAFSKPPPPTATNNSINLVINRIDSSNSGVDIKPQPTATAAGQYTTTYRTSYQKHSS